MLKFVRCVKTFVKRFVIAIVILVLLVAGFVFSPVLPLTVKEGIEHFGSKAINTDVYVDKVEVSPISGEAAIYDLDVSNPDGFSQPYVFRLSEIKVDIDMKSLTTDTVVVNSIDVDTPKIFLENMGENLKVLMDNVEKPQKAPKKVISAESKGKQKDIHIKNLVVKSPTIVLSGSELSMGDIVLRDIKTSDPKEVINKLMNEVMNGATGILGGAIDSLNKMVTGTAKEITSNIKEEAKHIENTVKDTFEKEAEDVVDSLKDTFKKEKEDLKNNLINSIFD